MKPLLQFVSSIRPERFFLFTALFFGSVMLVIVPPFQVPDEFNHFYRSYQISEGKFIAEKKDQRLGGELPVGLKNFGDPFYRMHWNKNQRISKEVILSTDSIKLNKDQKVFIDFPNTALYNPVSYAPQSFAIFLMRIFRSDPFWLFYFARIFTFVFWLSIIFISIRQAPVFKWLFTLLALLPMSLCVNMSLSADVVTNAVAFYLITYILKSAFGENKFTRRELSVFLLLAAFITFAKLVYAPLLLLFFLIPPEKFGSMKRRNIIASALFAVSFFSAFACSIMIKGLYTPYSEYNPSYRDGLDLMKGANVGGQMNYIMTHGFYVLHVFWNSITLSSEMFIPGYIGTFGWLDTYLPVGLIIIAYCVIIFATITAEPRKNIFTGKQRWLITLTMFCILFLLVLSQHVSWDYVGGSRVYAMQGRYFIPIFPLLFMIISRFAGPYMKLAPMIIMIFVFYCSLSACSVLYSRYYGDSGTDASVIHSDMEAVSSDNYFLTDHEGIELNNGGTISTARARSGKCSSCVYPNNAFGPTWQLPNGHAGDRFHSEVWEYGNDGILQLVVGSGKFALASSDPVETDAHGWKKLVLDFTLPDSLNEKDVGIFVWNPKQDTIYFDDLTIEHHGGK